ncbi:MAG: signal peptidase I [Kistimonas sp.]|nr:signal peptidase I [Kistimonas sp.]
MNFPLILVSVVCVTGMLTLLDTFVLAGRRKRAVERYQALVGAPDSAVVDRLGRQPAFIESARSVFPVLLLVLVLRSFLYEPFQIPSGSMEPTLDIGDFILVDKHAYGLRLPVTGTKVLDTGKPERGDVMVFRQPGHPQTNFIKRVVGLPGDRITYRQKTLYINGERVVAEPTELPPGEHLAGGEDMRLLSEKLGKATHLVKNDMGLPNHQAEGRWQVPPGHYFVMGDNRDRSNDSRFWGFVPEANLVGKAIYIWMHWPCWGQLPDLRNNGSIQ